MNPANEPTTHDAITDNAQSHRFEMKTDDKVSFVVYEKLDDETLALTHTEVDPSLEGQGVGSRLVQAVLTRIEQNNQKIVPLCPFVNTYVKRHPDWQRVVSTTHTATGF